MLGGERFGAQRELLVAEDRRERLGREQLERVGK
jgi:hypothetical protein